MHVFRSRKRWRPIWTASLKAAIYVDRRQTSADNTIIIVNASDPRIENGDFKGWYAARSRSQAQKWSLPWGRCLFLRLPVDTIPFRTMKTVKRHQREIPSIATVTVKQTKRWNNVINSVYRHSQIDRGAEFSDKPSLSASFSNSSQIQSQ